MRKVSIVGSVGVPACYGGFESLVENLISNNHPEIQYTVYASGRAYKNKVDIYKGAHIRYIPLEANGAQSVIYDICSLLLSIRTSDVVLILGVSGCLFLPIFKFFYNGLIVTNIDGLEWRRSKWGNWAKRFLKFSECLAVKYSDVIIADNQAITDYVLKEYNKKALTIAYGGDHALCKSKTSNDYLGGYYLSICRIEPENNIEMILQAFSNHHDLQLKFIGNWCNSEYGIHLKKKYAGCVNIEIIESIYDIDELYKYRYHCVGYVHGHSAGGTNPSLVEIMHFSKPIFSFDCDFNRYTTEGLCYYYSTADELASSILNNTASYQQVGRDMERIAKQKYTWSVISRSYEDVFC